MTPPLDEAWRVGPTADYLCARSVAVAALQFPDDQLGHAAAVATAVSAACEARGRTVQVGGAMRAPRSALPACRARA